MSNAVDLAGKLNANTVAGLVQNGVSHVGRYLAHDWRGLTVDEVNAINGAGLQIFSIFEKNPTRVSYFTSGQGQADAQEAYNLAKEIGQPEGTAIYFTVDYAASANDFGAIQSYFQAVKDHLQGYKMGAYGNFDVLTFLQSTGLPEYYFQTYAWSSGRHINFGHIFQYQNDKAFAGLQVDFDNLEKTDVGAWGNGTVAQSQGTNPFIQVVKVLVGTDIRADHSHTSAFIKDAKSGEDYNVVERFGDWHKVILDDKGNSGWIDGNGGQNLFWVNNPALSQQPAETTYTIQSGDTLGGIATKFGTTIATLKTLNSIQNENVIIAGQTIKISGIQVQQPVYHTVVPGDTVGALAKQFGSTIDQIKAWNNLDNNYTIYADKTIRVK